MKNLRVTRGDFLVLGFVLACGLSLHAENTNLKLMPPGFASSGTFYLLQQIEKGEAPPFPCNPFQDSFPELPVYSLGSESEGLFLVDDSSVDHEAWLAIEEKKADQPEGAQMLVSGVGPGCGLWLSINASNDVALLTLHNTREGQTYTLWSIEDLTQTNWMVETNVTGESGDLTETVIAMGQRTNLFLRASEYRDYVTNTVFQGLNYTNTFALVADTMGAVGPNHFVELLNGVGTNTAIAVFDKSGVLVSRMSMTNFLVGVGSDGTNYPTGQTADPRILFDHQSHRWIATAMQQSAGIVILAVSNDESPTNLVTGWTKYVIGVGKSGFTIDYDTLGVDGNGIYLSVLQLQGTNIDHTIIAIKKPEIYQGTKFDTQIQVTNDLSSWTIQPAVNFDDVVTNGLAWFVAKGPPDLGTSYQGGAVLYRRLQWQGTNAAWVDTNWMEISNSGSGYQDYYELGGTNFNVVSLTTGIFAPQAGTTNGINLFSAGSRLMMAVVRNGYIWTCHAVGLRGTNGTYVGDASGTDVDRSGIQWFRLQISPDGSGLTLSDHGRVFDSSATNSWWYHYPSLAVNCAGDMVAGFSGSSATNYVGAFYTWRLAGGLMPDQPRLIQAGTTNIVFTSRWGDYSATTSDPTDDWSIWTVQEYATFPPGSFGGRWGTVVAKIRPNP